MIWISLVLLLLAGWDLGWWVAGVRPMAAWRLKRLLRDHPERVALVDVRTPAEYRLFHIPGAEHRPDLLGGSGRPAADDPGRDLVVVCMTGHRSPVAAYGLKDAHPGRVYNLVGGMVAWKLFGGKSVSSE